MPKKSQPQTSLITFQLYLNEQRDVPNISIYESGWEKCSPGHNFGPVVREYYFFHFIVNGKGDYRIGNEICEVGQGEIFIITPGEEHQYTASLDDPWEYYWIGFHGSDAKSVIKELGLSDIKAFKIKDFNRMVSVFKSLKDKEKTGFPSTYFLIAKFYELMSIIAEERRIINDYQNPSSGLIPSVIRYINSHCGQGLSVTRVAETFNVNRSHLFRLFKEKMDISIQHYINELKMSKALLLLKNPQYSVKEITELVGFIDYPNFLKQFKKKYGVTPKQYRIDPFETEHA